VKKLLSPPNLYLASRSPRRQDLLNQAGLKFQVYVPREEEKASPKNHGKLSPAAIVKRIAAAKARAAHRELREKGVKEGVILAADTLVFYRGKVLGKPKNVAEARRMLGMLSGNWHLVSTAVSCWKFEGRTIKGTTSSFNTKVKFFPLEKEWIHWYVLTGEPMDKAGSYGAQNQGATMIERISGSYTNVVGLPIGHTLRLLEKVTGLDRREWMKNERRG
jgi:septum formation protein